ncbi:MAG TPA: hypothetical protein VEQ61_00890 [Thermoleophilaceae bacterium]|nr:hypothetical protein [Thermoleophilaceae bacterium]
MRFAVIPPVLALALAGCSVGGDGDEPARERDGESKPRSAARAEAGAIRAWSTALNEGDYEAAAGYFAKGALVEQTRTLRLPNREAAVAFNRSLPCKADLTDLERERGRGTVLAAFRLRDGSGGPCEGGARVRFRFRGGKFAEWRQLPQPEQPDGPVV